ncbi:DUF4430 domain-containing protein [Ruminococcus sp.]|uniref:DUF4430 domain-containing protein n=1 Tax=Ruminococcus sp. TaxID=41978 RepID=UPI0025F2C3CF|nr:DUF4430 domain-containing protein [Ruminococcus sp.]MCR4640065.1 DUF4430 domain-containing protein [Ruminococcus sp.]
MRNKVLTGFLCIVLSLVLSLCCVPVEAQCSEHTAEEVSDLIGGIVDYKLSHCGAGSIDEWLSGEIAEGAGTTSDWYALALSQYGYTDLSAYERSLSNYLSSSNVLSATSREKYALGLAAAGSENSYITDILDSSIGEQGMMSWIYGLHVLNNGYTCSKFTADSVVDSILTMQYGDGGWALFGEHGDIDVTAMTVQALAPHIGRGDVSSAVDRAMDFLSAKQKPNGGYESFGTPNPESPSQVLTALSALNIDCRYDERFIKDGHDLIDGIAEYRLDDGSFCHTKGGESNPTATVQAFYSLIAFRRMTEGKSPLLVLDNRRLPEALNEGADSGQHESEKQPQTTASSIAVTTASKTTAASAAKTAATLTVTAKTGTSAADGSGTISTSGESITSTTAASRIGEAPKGKAHKPFIILIIMVSAGVISLVVFITGKRNIKNYLFILIIAGAAIAVVLLLDIQSAEDYYSGSKKVKKNIAGTVTMEIRCDTIAGRSDSGYIPADGVILPPTAFDFESGETVFDILTEAAQTYGIQVENRGSAGGAHGMVYIAGINYIYEYDFGDLSGWVYHVNGVTPSRGCGEYELSDGDRIEWLYTCETGHDINEVYEK